jgi:hypothetical protein
MIGTHEPYRQDTYRPDPRSLGDLFAELGQEIRTLLRQEWLLARTEMSQKVSRVGKDVAVLALGGAVLYAGFLAILATIIIALAIVLPWWLAALIVAVVVTAAGGALVWAGLAGLRSEDLTPRQTMATFRDDATWVKREI